MPRGRPRKVPASVQITSDHEFDSSVLRFRRAVGEVLGSGIHVHLAAVRLRPARLAELAVGRPRFAPLRWSSLTDTQKKAMEDLVLARGAEDFVMYGDTCVVTCPEAEWEAEQRRKGIQRRQQEEADLSPRQLSREVGLTIDTDIAGYERASAPRAPDR